MSDGPRAQAMGAVVVLHDSAAVIEDGLRATAAAAPRRGVRIVVVDNASRDDGPARAARLVGPDAVVALGTNRGFAAGVNAGMARVDAPYVAVVNPDLRLEPGALDRLADFLDAHPRAALVGPRVVDPRGRREATAGVFPTPQRERAHARLLDRLAGRPGRRRPQPERDERVDWISGCAWLLRRDAWTGVGPLDEGYFMYLEDVDWCRRVHDAGLEAWVHPDAVAVHARGTGSAGSAALPADGGLALLRYLLKFHGEAGEAALAATLAQGWRLRRAAHAVLGALGRRGSRALAARYALALEQLARRRPGAFAVPESQRLGSSE